MVLGALRCKFSRDNPMFFSDMNLVSKYKRQIISEPHILAIAFVSLLQVKNCLNVCWVKRKNNKKKKANTSKQKQKYSKSKILFSVCIYVCILQCSF